MDAIPECRVHVLRNLYVGDESKFELYAASKAVRPRIESGGGKALNFPDLADHVADDLYKDRLTTAAAVENLLREATRKAAAERTHELEKRLSRREKRNCKRMAQVAAVFTIAAFIRKPEDIVTELGPDAGHRRRARRQAAARTQARLGEHR